MPKSPTVYAIYTGCILKNKQTGIHLVVLSDPKETTQWNGRTFTIVSCFFHEAEQYRSMRVSDLWKYYKPAQLAG